MKEKYIPLIVGLVLFSDVTYSVFTHNIHKVYDLFGIDTPFELYIGLKFLLVALCFYSFFKDRKS